MTNEELIADIKQFITVTISQATADLATREELADLATKQDINDLRIEMNERFEEVLNAEVIKDHERRITKLEHKLA